MARRLADPAVVESQLVAEGNLGREGSVPVVFWLFRNAGFLLRGRWVGKVWRPGREANVDSLLASEWCRIIAQGFGGIFFT